MPPLDRPDKTPQNAQGTHPTVRALVLAAARGPDDPMAKAFGLPHKCLLEVGGEPMLRRVVRALKAAPEVRDITIVIDDEAAAMRAFPAAWPRAL